MNAVTKPQNEAVEAAQLLSEREQREEQLKLRLYSGDGRSEIISVPATASVGALRLAICDALVYYVINSLSSSSNTKN